MPNQRLISLNASGGAQVVVVATIPCRYYDVIEDASANGGAAQGLIYQVPEDGFAGTYQCQGSVEPLIEQEPIAQGRGHSRILGYPAQNSSGNFNFIAAGTLFKATSATANTTKIRFREQE